MERFSSEKVEGEALDLLGDVPPNMKLKALVEVKGGLKVTGDFPKLLEGESGEGEFRPVFKLALGRRGIGKAFIGVVEREAFR